MRILFINYEYPPIGGGAATASWHIAREIARKGHSAVVLTSGFRGRFGWETEDGVAVFRSRTLRKRQAESTPAEMALFLFTGGLVLPRMLRNGAFDAAIVFFSIPCGPLGLLCRFLARVPYVVSLRGADVPGNEPSLEAMHLLLQPLRRTVLRHSRAVVANSDGLKTLSEEKDPFPVQVIPNGVDTTYFFPAPDRRDPVVRFLFAGRFREQKNLFFLLEQMDGLASTTSKVFELHLVGDGPLKEDLVAYGRSLSIRERIHWHPWCDKDRLRDHFHHADCFVLPSLYEGMPNVVLEAMACGLPVIASRVIGNSEVVLEKKTGFLFPLQDPGELQRIVSTVLERRESARIMGEAARAHVERCFSWEKVSMQYLQLLEGPLISEPLDPKADSWHPRAR
jgi:glycosyltransferase involved in cell wall biosynthesis